MQAINVGMLKVIATGQEGCECKKVDEYNDDNLDHGDDDENKG